MGKGSWLGLVVVIVVFAVAYHMLLGGEFALGYGELEQIYRSNGVAPDSFAPAGLLQINALENDLKLFESRLMRRAQTDDVKALLALIDLRKETLKAEHALLKAKQHSDAIGLYSPDCALGGAAARAEEELQNVRKHSSDAATKADGFVQGYPTQAQVAGLDYGGRWGQAMQALYNHADELSAYILVRCS